MVDRQISVGVDVQAFNQGINQMRAALKSVQTAVNGLSKTFQDVSNASTKARQKVVENNKAERTEIKRTAAEALAAADKQRKDRITILKAEEAERRAALEREKAEAVRLALAITEARREAALASGAEQAAAQARVAQLQREIQLREKLIRQFGSISNAREALRAQRAQQATVDAQQKAQRKALRDQKAAAADGLAAIERAERRKQAAIKETERVRREAARGRRAIEREIGAGTLQGPVGIRQQIGTQLQELEQAARRAGVSAKRVQEIFRNMRRGVTNQVSATEVAVVRRLTTIQNSLDRLRRANRGAVGQILLDWKTLARVGAFQVVHSLISRTTFLLREAIQTAQEFGKTTTLILTLVEDSAGGFGQWADAIKDVSNEFGGTLTDTASAVFEAVSNQIVESTQEARLFASEVAKLARITGDSFEDAGSTVSGLVNAYQTGLSEVNDINSKLFAAVDLGRFQLSDVADQLGRAAPQANQLGVSLEELLASLSVLTIEGRNANSSITLIRNVILKLLKPSEEFEKLLNRMGFATGRAAVQQLGLFGVLRKLSTEIPRSKIPELFPELRALEGVTSLATNSFDTFATNFAKIGGADAIERIESLRGELGELGVDLERVAEEFDPQERFARAFEITEESPFTQVEKELNRVRNLFAEDFGETAINTFAKINSEIGGLSNVLSDLGTALVDNVLVDTLNNLLGILTGLTRSTVGFEGAIKTGTIALKVFVQTWVVLKIASSEFVANALKGLGALVGRIQLATASARTFGATVRTLGKSALGLLRSPTVIVAGIITAVELAKAAYQDLFNTQERFIARNKARVEREVETVGRLNKASLVAQQDVLNTATTEIEEFFKNRVNKARENQKALKEAEQEFTNFIATTVKDRIKRFEEFNKAVSDTIGSLNNEITKRIDTITDLRLQRAQDVFETELRLSKVRDRLTERSLKAEIDLVNEALKEIDNAISESEKRVIDLQRSNQETQRAFVSGLRTEQEQFNALIIEIGAAADAAQAAVLAGTTDVAREQLERAAMLNSDAQSILKSQIQEAQQAAEAAREAAAGEGLTGPERAEQLAEANQQFAIAEQKLQALAALEQERRDIVADQLSIEQEIQDVKAAERLRVEEQLAELQRQQLTFARQQEETTFTRIDSLRELSDQALESGQIERAIEFLKEQETLLEDISQARIQAFQAAQENEDLETANNLLRKIEQIENERRAVAEERIAAEEQGIEQAATARSQLEELVGTAQRNLIAFKEVAKEAQTIRFFDADGVAKDSELIKGALSSVFDELDRLSKLPSVDLSQFQGLAELRAGIVQDINEFGEGIDIRQSVDQAITFLNNKFTEFKSSEALSLPVRTDIESLQTSLDTTSEILKAADITPLRIKFNFEDVELLSDQISQVLSKTQQDINAVAGSLGDLLKRRVELGPEVEGQFEQASNVVKANIARIRSLEETLRLAQEEDVKTGIESADGLEVRLNALKNFAATFGIGTVGGEELSSQTLERLEASLARAVELSKEFGTTNIRQVREQFGQVDQIISQIVESGRIFEKEGALGLGLGGNINVQDVVNELNKLRDLAKEQAEVEAGISARQQAQEALENRLSIIEDLGEKLAAENDTQRQRNEALEQENQLLATNLELRDRLRQIVAGDVADIRPIPRGGGAGAGDGGETNVTIETNVNVEGTAGESPAAFANRVAVAVRDANRRGLLRFF